MLINLIIFLGGILSGYGLKTWTNARSPFNQAERKLIVASGGWVQILYDERKQLVDAILQGWVETEARKDSYDRAILYGRAIMPKVPGSQNLPLLETDREYDQLMNQFQELENMMDENTQVLKPNEEEIGFFK
jgi:hypothetical protein